jgi:hypothetical protein
VVDIAAYTSVSMTAAHAVFTGPASTSPIDGRSPLKRYRENDVQKPVRIYVAGHTEAMFRAAAVSAVRGLQG